MMKTYQAGIAGIRWLGGTLQYALRPIHGGAVDWFDVPTEVATSKPAAPAKGEEARKWEDSPHYLGQPLCTGIPATPAPTATAEPREREAFEAWVATYMSAPGERDPAFPEGYTNIETCIAWDAWQARATLKAAPGAEGEQ